MGLKKEPLVCKGQAVPLDGQESVCKNVSLMGDEEVIECPRNPNQTSLLRAATSGASGQLSCCGELAAGVVELPRATSWRL